MSRATALAGQDQTGVLLEAGRPRQNDGVCVTDRMVNQFSTTQRLFRDSRNPSRLSRPGAVNYLPGFHGLPITAVFNLNRLLGWSP